MPDHTTPDTAPEHTSLEELRATPHARPFDPGEPQVIRLSLAAGERVDPHSHPERTVLIHLYAGQLELDLDEETHDLAAGDVVRFDGRREVSPRAVTDSEALVVLTERASN